MSNRVHVSLSDPVYEFVSAEAKTFGTSIADRLSRYAEDRFAGSGKSEPNKKYAFQIKVEAQQERDAQRQAKRDVEEAERVRKRLLIENAEWYHKRIGEPSCGVLWEEFALTFDRRVLDPDDDYTELDKKTSMSLLMRDRDEVYAAAGIKPPAWKLG